MKTTIIKSEELIREIGVELDIKEFQNNINKEINKLTKTAKINGFRHGKVPAKIIKQKFGKNIKFDVANKMVNEVLPDVIAKENLNPTSAPDLIELDTQNEQALKFVLKFEVYPEVSLAPINELDIEIIQSQLTEDDLNKTFDDICKQNATYSELNRKSANGNKVNIDFIGTIDGEKFQGGEAKNFDVILGDNKMIPGFEQGLLAKKPQDKTTLELKFPKDYQVKDLANKQVFFDITINSVMAVKVPELNDEIVKKYGENSVAEFKEHTKKHMQDELQKRLDSNNKDAIFSSLLKANDIVVPESIIETEAQNIAKNMQQQAQQSSNYNNIDSSIFHKQAKERVQLSLLMKETVDKNNISVDDEQIKDRIKQIAKEHSEDENTVINWHYEDKTRLANIESLLLEELVVKHITNSAKIKTVNKTLLELK